MFFDLLKDYGPALSPLVIGVSAVVAIASIRSAARTARVRATLDMIEKAESTVAYREMQEAFSRYRRANKLHLLNSPSNAMYEQDRDLVLGYLNHYELVAIGIAKNALDEDYYGAWMKGPLVRDWNAAAEFIQRERWKWDANREVWTYRRAVWENYQGLATRWSVEAIKLTALHNPPPDQPSGVGDEALPVTKAAAPNMVNQS